MEEFIKQILSAARQILREEIQQAVLLMSTELTQSTEPANHVVDDGYMTQAEAAAYLRVTKATVIAWTKRGLIKTYRIGKSCRYLKRELDAALLNKNRRTH